MKTLAYQWFKKPFFGRFMKPWKWPKEAIQADWRRLNFRSQSGADISALIGEAHTREDKGAVLMCHPMGVSAKGFWIKYGHADLLRAAGYHVMVFDFNGFGESQSTTMDYPLDVLSAGIVLQREFPALNIGVVGASLGAAMAMCSMANHDHVFKAAVLESAFPTLLDFWSRYPIPKMGIIVSKIFYPAGERKLRPLYAAERLVNKPPMLLIYGEEDEFTPVHDGMQLHSTVSQNTSAEFWSVPGAKHTHAFAAQPEQYADKIVTFLDAHIASLPALERAAN